VTIRRSERNIEEASLDRHDIQRLLIKIRSNHVSTVILKLKNELGSNITATIIENIIFTLFENDCCQALYFQNIPNAMNSIQLSRLGEMLICKKNIWCLNIGENYNLSNDSLSNFCNDLRKSNITHLYISENLVTPDLKVKFRDVIRCNRKKHGFHNSVENRDVIESCTNMWW
jgi:hypothetical protein